MKIIDDQSFLSTVPPYATNCGAAGYRSGDGKYIDLFFLRATFQLNTASKLTTDGETNLQHQKAEIALVKVGSVTIPEDQAKELIRALTDQLERLKEL